MGRLTKGMCDARRGGVRALSSLVLAFLLSWGPAHGDEGDVGQRRAVEWRQALSELSAQSGPFDGAALGALDRQMPSFDPEALEALSQTDEVNQFPDELGNRVRHALRALAYHRKLGSHLDQGSAIALLLGSSDESAWSRALMELCREPFGERLGIVAERLSADARGPMRMMAGRIASYLNAFCGGHGSAWGATLRTEWNPTPLVRRVARRLLDDRNPAVACSFASLDAYALEDKQVVDWMVERLWDDRQTPRVSRGLLRTHERNVGDACRDSLDAEFRFHRTPPVSNGALPRFLSEPPMRRVASLPEDGTRDSLASWWREVREEWSFRPDGEAWQAVLDHLVVLRPGEATVIETPRMRVRVRCSHYAEHPAPDTPKLSVHVDVDVDEGDRMDLGLGNPQHHLGFVARSTAASGIAGATGTLMCAPATADGVRMRVRLHVSPP